MDEKINTKNENKSLLRITWHKILDIIHDTPPKRILGAIARYFWAVVFSVFVCYPDVFYFMVSKIFLSFNGVLAWFCIFFYLIKFKKGIKKGIGKLFQSHENHHGTLSDLIFQKKTCKIEDLREFGFSAKKANKLAKKLEDVGILKRGENNTRILNDDFSKQELEKLIDDREIEDITGIRVTSPTPLPPK